MTNVTEKDLGPFLEERVLEEALPLRRTILPA
jgi:hypothetical protein